MKQFFASLESDFFAFSSTLLVQYDRKTPLFLLKLNKFALFGLFQKTNTTSTIIIFLFFDEHYSSSPVLYIRIQDHFLNVRFFCWCLFIFNVYQFQIKLSSLLFIYVGLLWYYDVCVLLDHRPFLRQR